MREVEKLRAEVKRLDAALVNATRYRWRQVDKLEARIRQLERQLEKAR